MKEEPQAPSLGEVVGAAAFVITLITAWLYVAGWTYAYWYFDQFRVPLILTGLPKEHVFVYGGLTIWKNPLGATAIAAVTATATFLCISFRQSIGRSLLATLVVALIVALFFAARLVGIHTALGDVAAQRTTDFAAYPRVVIEFGADPNLSDGQKEASSGCARLLLATGDRLFLFVPRRDMPALELNTLIVLWSDAVSVTISQLTSSCP